VRAVVHVQLKPGVLDVEGKAIEGALHGLGFAGVSEVRVGKTIAFELASEDAATAEAEVRRMAEQLLANPVIENWRVEFSAQKS
jgi:phosphoribosylformylglycinamidine synthase PurS subunit